MVLIIIILIIVPSRLTSQWESEIEKYVKDKFNLRAKSIKWYS